MSDSAEIDEAKAILNNHLEYHKMRKTLERYAILEMVMTTEGHHSADQYVELMPKSFTVSRATMYTTLQMFDEIGILTSHQVHGITLYERAYKVTPHHHYICTECHTITDLIAPEIDKVLSSTRTPKFSKMRNSAYIYGLCTYCKAKIAKRRKKYERMLEQERTESTPRDEVRIAKIGEELGKVAEELGIGH